MVRDFITGREKQKALKRKDLDRMRTGSMIEGS
jgi:hypothetical protein